MVADSSKAVKVLGKFPLPVLEALRSAWALVVERKIASLGGVSERRDEARWAVSFLRTTGNQILDLQLWKDRQIH